MERVKWEKPRAEVQAFVADDYVAACWDVLCDDVPTDGVRWVYRDNNKSGSYEVLYDDLLTTLGHGDNRTHLVKTEGDAKPSYNAMVARVGKSDYAVYYFENNLISRLTKVSPNNRPNHS